MKVPRRDNNQDWPELPELTPLLCEITKSEPDKSPFKDDAGNEKMIVKLVFKVLDPNYANGRIWDNPGLTIATKPRVSRLRQLIAAVLPKDATEDDFYSFEVEDLVGKKVIVVGDYKDGDESRAYLRPMKYLRADGTPAPAAPKQESRQLVAAAAAATPASADDIDF